MSAVLKIVVIYGSVRDGRMNARIGSFVTSCVESNSLKPIVFDPLVMPFELLKQPLHWMKDQSAAPTWLIEADQSIKEADGFLIVTPEYNSGVPPALLNMLDHFSPKSYSHKPCGIISYSLGSFGGTRAATLLLPTITELGMIAVPTPVNVPEVDKAFAEDGCCLSERVRGNINNYARLLKWYAAGLKRQKEMENIPTENN